jgi:signal peptidase I
VSDPSDPTSESRAGDRDWIKGLVAQALIHAADSEVTDTPDTTENPALQPPLDATTGTPPTVDANRRSSIGEQPLIVGREMADRQAVPEFPVISPRNRSSVADGHAAETTGSFPAPPSDVHELPPNRSLGDPPLGAERGPLGVTERTVPDDATSRVAVIQSVDSADADEVMEPAEVVTEGFRTSDLRTVLEWLAVIVSALVVALLIKAFVLQAFYIPSVSMETTVNQGDRILVNKVSYRLHDVRRGDLVVFKKLPGTTSQTDDLIKRAVALPGETIEVRSDGRIWIWGPGETAEDAQLLQEPYLDPQNELLQPPSASSPLTQDVWDERCANQPRTPGRCTLADDQYFMMGDNRNKSSDSRFFGPVTEDLIVGRAFLRIWPLGEFSFL